MKFVKASVGFFPTEAFITSNQQLFQTDSLPFQKILQASSEGFIFISQLDTNQFSWLQ